MASSEQIRTFIATIGPIIQKEAKKRGYLVVSTVIAQACLESAYGTCALSPYHNYFGMKCGAVWKGPSVNLATHEEVSGSLVAIKDNFRCYASMEDGVAGYYDFINWSNYANLKVVNNYEMYAKCLKADGWATDSSYVTKLCKIVTDYNLTRFDDFSTIQPTNNDKVVLYRVITEKGLNVRKLPTTDSPVVACLKYKEIFPVSHIDGHWGYVTTKNGWSCLDYAEIK